MDERQLHRGRLSDLKVYVMLGKEREPGDRSAFL